MEAAAKANGPITDNESVRVAREELKKAMEAGENVLTPIDSVCNIPPMHRISIEKMMFSADPAEQEMYVQQDNDDDPPEKKKYTPTKRALLAIAHAGNVQVKHEFSGMTKQERNKEGQVIYIAWKVVGIKQNLDGSASGWEAEADIDFMVEEERILEGKKRSFARARKEWWTKKSPKEKEEYIKMKAREDFLNFKRYGAARCETSALLRLIRAFFPLLKGVYAYDKLQKPFVVARLVFRPDYADEYVRHKAIELAFKAAQGVYGIQAPSFPQPRQIPTQVVDMESPNGHSFEMPEAERMPEEPERPDDLPNGEPEKPRVKPVEEQKLDFENCDLASKVKTLEQLMKKKAFVRGKGKALNEYTPVGLMAFFEKLIAMTDKPAEDDIPF